MPESSPTKNEPDPALAPDLQDIFDNAPIGIFTSTPDGRYISVNPALAKMYGYDSPEDLIESITDIATQIYADPEDRKKFTRLLEEHGEVVNHECRFRHRNGTNFWVSRNARAMTDQAGHIIAYQGFTTDITERKRLEDELRMGMELSDRIIEDGPMAITQVDRDGNIIFANRHAERLLGLEKPDIHALSYNSPEWLITDIDGSPFPDERLPFFQIMSTDQAVYQVQHAIITPDTDRKLLSINGAPLHDEQGRIDRIVFAIHDITDLKRAEDALLKSEQRFRLCMEAIKDGLWDWDVTTGNIYCSPALTSMLGYDSTDILTRVDDWQNLIHPEDRQRAYQANLDCVNNLRNFFKIEYRMKCKNGGWKWILGRGSAVHRDNAGRATRMIGTHQDITEQKQSEQRIRHLNAVLQAYIMVNQVIFHAREMNLLLNEICQALISTRCYHNAWIILLDDDRNVTDWGQAGLDENFPELLAMFQDGNMTAHALNVLSSNLPQVVIDPRKECRDCPLAESYAGSSSFSVRLEVEGAPLGLLSVSVPQKLVRDSEEHQLFTSLARSISQGVQRIRLENIRRMQRERLKNYERIISRVDDGMCIVTPDYRYMIVNDAYLREFGKSREEIECHTVEYLLGKDIFQEKVKPRLDAALAGKEVDYEEIFPGRNASLKYKEISYYPFYEQEGHVAGVVVTGRDITKSKNTEEELKEARLFLTSTLDNLPYNIAVLDDQGKIIFVNQPWKNFAEENDMPSDTISEGINYLSACYNASEQSAAEAIAFAEGIRMVVCGESDFYSMEYACHSPDKSRWFIGQVTPFSETPPRRVVVGHGDITELKLAEEAIRESETRFRILFNDSPVSIIVHDTETGAIVDANEAAYRTYGLSSLEELQKNNIWIAPPYSSDDAMQWIRRATLAGVQQFEWKNKRVNGEVFWEHVTLRSILISGTERILSVAIDITDRKRAEEALLESEKRLKLAQRVAKIGDFIWNVGTGEITWSDGLYELLGYNKSEKISYAWVNSELHHPEDLERVNKWLNDCIESGSDVLIPNEYRVIRKDKMVIHVQATGMIERKGSQITVFATVQDITQRKQDEEKIRLINHQLQKANAEKDKLFSIIAHDLKSPMCGLLGSTEMLADPIEIFSEQEVRLLSKEIHKSTQNTFALLEDLLQWARMSQGGMDFAPKACVLNELVDIVLSTALVMVKAKDITVRLDLPQGLTVFADPPMLKTVIRNILFNAIKFTHRGGKIAITAQQQKQVLTMAIKDNGIGMNQNTLSSIFSFEKSKRQLGTDGEKGTGLGLVLCKQFIEQHGGEIWVESAPGQGTTVFFTVPISD